MRRKFVAGNWKMNGSLAENQARLTQLRQGLKEAVNIDIAVFSSAPYLAQCKSLLSGSSIQWGAQNVSEHTHGAYTGELSTDMLQDFSCKYTLVGHSERREIFKESNERVAEKFAQALAGNIVPVLCVGETLQQREDGQTMNVIATQLQSVLNLVGIQEFARGVVAYEPVWAIGTGKTATPEQAQEIHEAIRNLLAQHDENTSDAMQILYGGSVKPNNAAAIFAQPDVDGALVGGASLNADDFIKICCAAA